MENEPVLLKREPSVPGDIEGQVGWFPMGNIRFNYSLNSDVLTSSSLVALKCGGERHQTPGEPQLGGTTQ